MIAYASANVTVGPDAAGTVATRGAVIHIIAPMQPNAGTSGHTFARIIVCRTSAPATTTRMSTSQFCAWP